MIALELLCLLIFLWGKWFKKLLVEGYYDAVDSNKCHPNMHRFKSSIRSLLFISGNVSSYNVFFNYKMLITNDKSLKVCKDYHFWCENTLCILRSKEILINILYLGWEERRHRKLKDLSLESNATDCLWVNFLRGVRKIWRKTVSGQKVGKDDSIQKRKGRDEWRSRLEYGK